MGDEIVADKSELGLRAGVALALALVGFAVLSVALNTPNPLAQPVGPGYVPALLGGCMLILSAWDALLAIRELRSDSASVAPMQGVRTRLAAFWNEESNWLTLTVLLAMSLFLWGNLGSFVGLTAASFSLIWVDRALGLKKGILYAVIVSSSMWFLFEKILRVSIG